MSDFATAEDGTRFTLQTERVRGEPAFYTVLRWERQRWVVHRDAEGSYRKSTARSRMRRAAREWKGGEDG